MLNVVAGGYSLIYYAAANPIRRFFRVRFCRKRRIVRTETVETGSALVMEQPVLQGTCDQPRGAVREQIDNSRHRLVIVEINFGDNWSIVASLQTHLNGREAAYKGIHSFLSDCSVTFAMEIGLRAFSTRRRTYGCLFLDLEHSNRLSREASPYRWCDTKGRAGAASMFSKLCKVREIELAFMVNTKHL